MATTYEFWYDETTTRKAYFEADDNGHALGIMSALDRGDLHPEDIDTVYFKDVSYTIGVDIKSLSRLDGEDV